jgi:hypothetical protein
MRRTRGTLRAGVLLVAAAALGLATASVGVPASAGFNPVIGPAVSVPGQPVAGKRFAVSFTVTRSDTGARLTRGTMICDPSIAGKVLQHAESFRAGVARLAFTVPSTPAGKLLKVKVTIKAAGAAPATKLAVYRVLAAAKPALSVAEAAIVEGNAGTSTLSFPVTLSAASTQAVSVAYATSDGTATEPADYARASGTLTFAAGETSKVIVVGVVGDLVIEQDEMMTMTLSDPVNATIANAAATGTITNDDTAVPVTAGAYKGALEGNALFFDVADRYVTHFRSNYIRMDCDSGGIYVYGPVDWDGDQFLVGPDATFQASRTNPGTVSGQPATFHHEVMGRFNGTNAAGTVLDSVEWDRDGTHLRCTSGTRPWTASLQP